MANFDLALKELLNEEGGYVNNSADAGGETVFGIARAYNRQWVGWALVDNHRSQHANLVELNRALAADVTLMNFVADFYRHKFWSFDDIASQAAAQKLLEMEVNFGQGTAVKILQQGLVRLGHNIGMDGVMGQATLAAAENTKEPDLLHALRAFSALYRVHRVLARPDQMEFIEGWLWRDTA